MDSKTEEMKVIHHKQCQHQTEMNNPDVDFECLVEIWTVPIKFKTTTLTENKSKHATDLPYCGPNVILRNVFFIGKGINITITE